MELKTMTTFSLHSRPKLGGRLGGAYGIKLRLPRVVPVCLYCCWLAPTTKFHFSDNLASINITEKMPHYYLSFLLLLILFGSVEASIAFLFHHPSRTGRRHASALMTFLAAPSDRIEYQSDETKYGRGETHLSADLDSGDVVVYQTGTWLVDGVPIGDGGPPKFRYGLVETIQLVWTHNCEHGVIRALPLSLVEKKVLEMEAEETIEFGPEQLVAKIPVTWNENAKQGVSTIELSNAMWEAATESVE